MPSKGELVTQVSQLQEELDRFESVRLFLPWLERFKEEASNFIDPNTATARLLEGNPDAWLTGDPMEDAYQMMTRHWIDEARRQAAYEIAREHGKQFMARMVGELLVTERPQLMAQ